MPPRVTCGLNRRLTEALHDSNGHALRTFSYSSNLRQRFSLFAGRRYSPGHRERIWICGRFAGRRPLSEGVETANLIKRLGRGDGNTQDASGEYEDDSHVINVRSRRSESVAFMPFGLRMDTLVVSWETGSGKVNESGLHVTLQFGQSKSIHCEMSVRISGSSTWPESNSSMRQSDSFPCSL